MLADQVNDFSSRLPPVEKWDPPLSGMLDMRIDKAGQWFYLGSLIQRAALVKLFSTILKKEGEQYFLVTPVEKWHIEVEDVPFLIVTMDVITAAEQQNILFTTNTEDRFYLSQEHPLWVVSDPHYPQQPRPYAMVRGNLPGLISRTVYYQLVDCAVEIKSQQTAQADFIVTSQGQQFSLQPH